MKTKLISGFILGVSIVGFPNISNGALLNAEVPDNAYITIGGFDVAWAAPCAAENPSCGQIDLSYQSQFGWQIMTEDIFYTLSIDYLDFVVENGNVDYVTGNNLDEVSRAFLGGLGSIPVPGDVAIAVPYFSSLHYYADWKNGFENLWDPISTSEYAEALVYRGTAAPVPEPSSILLFIAGLAFLIGKQTNRKIKDDANLCPFSLPIQG